MTKEGEKALEESKSKKKKDEKPPVAVTLRDPKGPEPVGQKNFAERLAAKDPPTKDLPVPADTQPSVESKPPTDLFSAKLGDPTPREAPKEKLNLKALIKDHLLAGAKRMEYAPALLHQLLDAAKESFKKQPTLVEVAAPVNICGDIHGQFTDLMRIFASCGLPFRSRYLFLGDYVDRGRHSLEVIVLLLACKVQVYGFNAEIRTRYREVEQANSLYQHFNDVFAEMPLAAIVAGRILCMHGGLSPELNSLDDIRRIQRPLASLKGLAQDLLWADPEVGVKGFQANKLRATSHVFGEDAVRQKLKQLGIDMIIRAHQVVEFGYAFFASRRLITIFSAARYHDDLCNYAAVVQVDERLEVSFVQLKPVEFEKNKADKIARTQDVEEGEE